MLRCGVPLAVVALGVLGSVDGAQRAWFLPAIDAGYSLYQLSIFGAAGGLLALRYLTLATWGLGLIALLGYMIALFWFDRTTYLLPALLLLAAALLPAVVRSRIDTSPNTTGEPPPKNFFRRPIKPPPGRRWSRGSDPGPPDFGAAVDSVIAGIRPRIGTRKDSVQILGVVTILIAAYNFWFTTYYEPTTRTPLLTLVADVERAGVRPAEPNQRPLVAFRAKLAAKNPSKGRVEVIASTLNVTGLTMSRTGDTTSAAYAAWLDERLAPREGSIPPDTPHYSSGGHASRFLKPISEDAIYAAIPLPYGLWFESGEDLSTTNVFHAPDGIYDYVSLDYMILVSRHTAVMSTIKRQYCVDDAGTLAWKLSMRTVGGERELILDEVASQQYGIALTAGKIELALIPQSPDGEPSRPADRQQPPSQQPPENTVAAHRC